MFASASPGLFAAALVFMLAEGFLPNLTLIFMGRATGQIPPAVTAGLDSAAGHALIGSLVAAGLSYALSLMRGPAEDALTAASRARLSLVMQRRLVEAVSTPPGIAHLEDPAVLDRLASAQGQLSNYQPADAPMTLIGQAGDRLSGLLACAVLATFRWWLGVLLLLLWLLMRRPLTALIRSRVGTYRRATEPLRRSWYFLALTWRPAAAKEMRVFGLGNWALGEHVRLWLEAMRPSWREAQRLNRRVLAYGVLVLAAYVLAVAAVAHAAYRGQISLGVLVVMLTMLPGTAQVGSVNRSDVSLESMLVAVPDLEALSRDLVATGPAEEGLTAAGLPRREVRFEAVSFRYPDAPADTLAGLELVLPAGTSTAIVGVNGAGKTTLVTLLCRLREPTGGRILIDRTPLNELSPREWQRQVAVVFQDFTRLPLTAQENVALGLHGEPPDEAALARAVGKAGAADLIEGIGWQTVLSPQYDGGQDLSGGQWQRIALARALYAVEQGARILVLDEPTAQLDVRAEAAFYDRFLHITRGVTTLVISHRFSTVRRADQIAVLDNGCITELGKHEELLAREGTYAHLFGLQAGRFAGTNRG